jgi:hypothetical protein
VAPPLVRSIGGGRGNLSPHDQPLEKERDMTGFKIFRPVMGIAAVAVALFASASSADTIPYDLAIESALEVKSPGLPKPQPIIARTALHYQVDRQGAVDEVAVNSLEVQISSEGRTLMNSRMNRQGATFQQGPKDETRIAADQATSALKQLLDQFGSPLARITRDAEGAEQAREVLIDKDSSLVENGVIDSTQIFDVRFPVKEDEWESKVKLSMGNGQFAQGTLRYKKAGTAPEGQVTVEVAGELKAEGKLGLGEIKNGKYRVTGQQTYDPARKLWSAGNLSIDVSLSMESGGHEAGTASGIMKIALVLATPTPGAASAAASPSPAVPAPVEAAEPEPAADKAKVE